MQLVPPVQRLRYKEDDTEVEKDQTNYNFKKLTTLVFEDKDDLVAVYEGFMEQHLLLAAAGVRQGNGYKGYYQDLETTMQIGTSEYFHKHARAVVSTFMEVAQHERGG